MRGKLVAEFYNAEREMYDAILPDLKRENFRADFKIVFSRNEKKITLIIFSHDLTSLRATFNNILLKIRLLESIRGIINER